jgi:hypothetical protein
MDKKGWGAHMGLWTKTRPRQFIKENKFVTAQDAQNALKICGNAAGNARGRIGYIIRLRQCMTQKTSRPRTS